MRKTTKCFKYIGSVLLILQIQISEAARFENLSIEDGLSQNTVFDIKQDKYGRLWIGTYDGLNLYDGVKFTHFTSKPKTEHDESLLTSSSVYDINFDQSGNLWLSTRKGLTYLDINTFKTKRFFHEPNNSNSPADNTLRYSEFDQKGNLWIASYAGLNMYDPVKGQFTLYKDTQNTDTMHKCHTKTRVLLIDLKGLIWVGDANKGLCRFDPETKQFTYIDYRNNPHDSASLGIRSLYQETPDKIWVGSTKGLFHYDIDTGHSVSYFHSPEDESSLADNWVQKIIKYDEEHLWMATMNGVSLFSKKTSKFKNFRLQASERSSLSSNAIYSIFQDNSGLLWVGTESAGVDKYNPRQTQFLTKSQSGKPIQQLSSRSVWDVSKAYGYIWLATTNGLNRIDPSNGNVKIYIHEPNNRNSIHTNNLYRVAADQNRDLWVTSPKGIGHFNIDTEIFTHYEHNINNPNSLPFNNIIAIKLIGDNIWLGSYGEGLAMVNFKKNIYKHYEHDPNDPSSISDNFITEIIDAPEGRILLATRNGVNQFDPKTGKFENITKNILPDQTSVSTVRFLKNGNLAMSSSDGLFILNRDSKALKKYTVQDGLSNDHIYSIEEDTAGNLWISSNFGISKVNPSSDKINNFDAFDGLQGYEFNSGASHRDGEYLYFGGFDGLTYFKPKDVVVGAYTPPVIITDFSVPGKQFQPSDLQKPINISYKDTYFSIEFSALDFTDPKKNKYLYKLEGYDKDWIDSGNRNYSAYTNLDGGNYTFRVKAANKYGVWNNKGASINIVVTPPFWETQWFRIIAGFSLIVIILTIYWLRVRAVHAHNKHLEEEVRLRTADLEKALIELGETKDALIESAHKAGMADSATGVLHNVGNLLNSVNTSANLIRDTIENSVSNKFLRANELLIANIENIKEFVNSNPKALPLLNYYAELDKPFRNEQGKLNENAMRLMRNITSIKETIAAQHRYAKGYDLTEELSIIDIIEDTLLLQSGSIGRHEIKVHKHFAKDLPKIKIQKIKLVQILLNLYKNAKESMDDEPAVENHLTIEAYKDELFAYIKVSDTGLGIQPDQLEAIFAYGYSTKPDGHGFGLHSCANYMTEMHGQMWAESKGPGHGATFVLKFPLNIDKQKQLKKAS